MAMGATVAMLGGVIAAIPAAAGPAGGGCQLQGQANFHPGPAADPSGQFAYDFAGDLTGCQSNAADAPASGHISAGQVITIGGVDYQEPVSTGTGSCATGTTAGTAIVQWDNGSTSVIDYSTTSAAAGVALQGTVEPSIILTSTDGTQTTTVSSTAFQGDQAVGLLAFEVTDPTQCTAPGGVTDAGIAGVTAIGSQNG